jgi:hypothetical protein
MDGRGEGGEDGQHGEDISLLHILAQMFLFEKRNVGIHFKKENEDCKSRI